MGHWSGPRGKQHPAACPLTSAAVHAPLLPPQWHIPKISAAGAWRFTTGSPEVKVNMLENTAAAGHWTAEACCRQEVCWLGCWAACCGCAATKLPCCCPPPPSSAAAATSHAALPVQVCHVDSGVRVDHPDLSANVLKGWNFVPAGQVSLLPMGRQAGCRHFFMHWLRRTLPGHFNGWLPHYDADAMLPPQSKLTPPP